MPAYIIQDAYTGYIWGDTRDVSGQAVTVDTPADACRVIDHNIGERDRKYAEVSRLSGDTGYLVYRVDIDGSEAVAVVHDGQDREAIEAVQNACEFVGYVEWTLAED